MCGFNGFVSLSENILSKEPSPNLIENLKRRGPDEHQILSYKNAVFHHSRLSIQDPGAGANQPFENSLFVIVFNGEIYNHAQLRVKYNLKCRDDSDTATLSELVKRLGISKALDVIDGMYAIAIFDKEANEVVLARDEYGQKPLYYGIFSDLVFSSVLSTFISHLQPSYEHLNEDAISDYFALGYSVGNKTLINGVYRVLPGEILRIYFKENEYKFNKKSKSLDKSPYKKDFQDSLIKITNECCVSDRGFGCLLSGGIDSSSVAVALKKSNNSFNTYTLSFEDREFDESNIALKTSKIIGSKHMTIKYNNKELEEVFSQLPVICDDPIDDPSFLPTAVLMKSIQRTDVVVLGGDGGDEQFGGYRRYKVLAYQRLILLMPLFVRKFLLRLMKPLLLSNIHARKFYKNLGLGRAKENIEKFEAVMMAKNLAQFASALICGSYYLSGYFNDVSNKNIKDKLVSFDVNNYLPNSVLTKVDRASMAFGVECRAPLLSSKWNNVNIENKVGKTQLRSFLKDNKLGFLLNSPKTGFGSPIDDLVLLDSFQDEIKLMNKSECFSKILKKYGHPKKIYRNLVLYKWMSYFGFLKN